MKILDLFCCEGGASEGYKLGGLEIIAGIDHDAKHIKNYNSRFPGKGYPWTWEEGLREFGKKADLIHASPPCQLFSSQSYHQEARERHLNLIPAVRAALRKTGKPYVIENVREMWKGEVLLLDPFILNARMFPGQLEVDWDVRITAKDYIEKIARESHKGEWYKKPPEHPAYYHYVVSEENIPTRWTIKRNRFFEIAGFTCESLPEIKTEREVMSVTQSPNPTMVWNKINRQSVPLWVRQKVMGGLDWMSAKGVGECIPPPYTRYIAEQFLKQAGRPSFHTSSDQALSGDVTAVSCEDDFLLLG